MPKAPSSSMASSPRPKSNPRNEASSSSSPRATTSSPRPKANPTLAAAAKPAASAANPLGKDNQGQGLNNATSAKPGTRSPAPPIPPIPPAGQTPGDPVEVRAPDNPAAVRNPNLPADSVQAARGERRTMIEALQEPGASRSAQKYRGTVLSSVYKLPANPANAAKTLQQFNGPRGQRMTLGA